MPSSVSNAVKREMPFHAQNAAPRSCITISGLPYRATARSKVPITMSARSASSTPWPTTKREWSSIRINVNVFARWMLRCTKSRCQRWFGRTASKRWMCGCRATFGGR